MNYTLSPLLLNFETKLLVAQAGLEFAVLLPQPLSSIYDGVTFLKTPLFIENINQKFV